MKIISTIIVFPWLWKFQPYYCFTLPYCMLNPVPDPYFSFPLPLSLLPLCRRCIPWAKGRRWLRKRCDGDIQEERKEKTGDSAQKCCPLQKCSPKGTQVVGWAIPEKTSPSSFSSGQEESKLISLSISSAAALTLFPPSLKGGIEIS